METAVILEGARTPIGKFLGSFSEISVELGRLAVREVLRRANVQPTRSSERSLGMPARPATGRTPAGR